MLLFLVQYHLPLSHRFNLDTRKIPNNKPLDHPIGCASIPPSYNCLSNHTTPLNRVPTNRGWHQRDILKNLLRNTNFLPRCLSSSPLLLLPFLPPFSPTRHPPKKERFRATPSFPHSRKIASAAASKRLFLHPPATTLLLRCSISIPRPPSPSPLPSPLRLVLFPSRRRRRRRRRNRGRGRRRRQHS